MRVMKATFSLSVLCLCVSTCRASSSSVASTLRVTPGGSPSTLSVLEEADAAAVAAAKEEAETEHIDAALVAMDTRGEGGSGRRDCSLSLHPEPSEDVCSVVLCAMESNCFGQVALNWPTGNLPSHVHDSCAAHMERCSSRYERHARCSDSVRSFLSTAGRSDDFRRAHEKCVTRNKSSKKTACSAEHKCGDDGRGVFGATALMTSDRSGGRVCKTDADCSEGYACYGNDGDTVTLKGCKPKCSSSNAQLSSCTRAGVRDSQQRGTKSRCWSCMAKHGLISNGMKFGDSDCFGCEDDSSARCYKYLACLSHDTVSSAGFSPTCRMPPAFAQCGSVADGCGGMVEASASGCGAHRLCVSNRCEACMPDYWALVVGALSQGTEVRREDVMRRQVHSAEPRPLPDVVLSPVTDSEEEQEAAFERADLAELDSKEAAVQAGIATAAALQGREFTVTAMVRKWRPSTDTSGKDLTSFQIVYKGDADLKGGRDGSTCWALSADASRKSLVFSWHSALGGNHVAGGTKNYHEVHSDSDALQKSYLGEWQHVSFTVSAGNKLRMSVDGEVVRFNAASAAVARTQDAALGQSDDDGFVALPAGVTDCEGDGIGVFAGGRPGDEVQNELADVRAPLADDVAPAGFEVKQIYFFQQALGMDLVRRANGDNEASGTDSACAAA